jgi:DNA repair protein RadC
MTIHIPDSDKIEVVDSQRVFNLMYEVLMREDEIDRGREHFWVLSLSNDNCVMLLELISLGSMGKTIVEPLEVFRLALQKKVAKVILIHNHPSGNLTPSEEDLDITDRLIQVGKIVGCPVIDHLIITEEDYTSFVDSGIFARLEKSTKYALDLSGASEKRGEQNKAEETAIKMIKKQKLDLIDIKEYTGLSIKQLEKIKNELSDQKIK